MHKIFKLSLIFLLTSLVHSEMKIDINLDNYIIYPIGIVPFEKINFLVDDVLKENIDCIISKDLHNSGKFHPLDIANLPQQPSSTTDVIPEIWNQSGVNVILIGQIKLDINNHYIISYELLDISNNTKVILIQNQYNVDKKWLRYAAHNASDEIFEKLTGIKGVFRTRIAYVVYNNNVYNNNDHQYPYKLYIADYDGYNPILIQSSLEPLMSPAWSPDGNKLVYVSFAGGNSSLVIHNLNKNIIHQITHYPRHNGAPAWSPDGNKLAFVLSKNGKLNLYIMDIDSKKIQQITYNHCNNTEPSWFPDSQTLVYTSDQSGHPQIYKININDNIIQRLSWMLGSNQNAHVSRNGKFLILVNINKHVQHLAKLDLITGICQILTDTLLDETPSIAPNDTMLIYSSVQNTYSSLKLISIDGHCKVTLPKINGHVRFPTWSPYINNINI